MGAFSCFYQERFPTTLTHNKPKCEMPTILLLFLISDFLNKPYHRYYYDDHKYADGYAAYFLLELFPF